MLAYTAPTGKGGKVLNCTSPVVPAAGLVVPALVKDTLSPVFKRVVAYPTTWTKPVEVVGPPRYTDAGITVANVVVGLTTRANGYGPGLGEVSPRASIGTAACNA